MVAIATALVLGIAATGCGGATVASPSPSAAAPVTSASAAPTTSLPSVIVFATPTAAASTTPPHLVIVDPTLLEHLPPSVDGVPIEASPETAASMTSDLELGISASAIAVGIALAPGDSVGDDLALVSVVRLRPGVFDERFFAGWREAYDAAACAPAGGVSSHRQQVIGARTVEVTGCAQDVTIYHVHLGDDLLVSITAAGARKFGERILAGLRE